MLTKTKIVLAAALILGTASAALAEQAETNGGFVVPGSMDGVNPAFHPGIFGNPNTARAYGFVQTQHGWVAAPSQTAHVQANQ
jgi:FtsP/CotA-like multicopper oxidase with cupredoxin domain